MGTLTLTSVAASVAYYFVTRPLPEKPLVPLENQSPLLEVRAWRISSSHFTNLTQKKDIIVILKHIHACVCTVIRIVFYFHLVNVANYIINLSICVFSYFNLFGFSEVKQIRWAAFDVHMSRAVFCMPLLFRFCCRHMILLISNCSRDFTRFRLLFSP